MSKDKNQQPPARVRSLNRQQKESQKWRPQDIKRKGNTRIRRISGPR